MKKLFVLPVVCALFFFLICIPVFAQAPKAKIYIASQKDSFETYLAAAFTKKHVPAQILTDPAGADYTLESAPVEKKPESTGGKIARCLFAYCAGIAGTESASVRLIDNKTKAVVWSYTVNKGHQNMQSLAEAVAKHLKNEFLK